MSYDVYFKISTGGPDLVTVAGRDHTSNTAQMWCDADCDIAEFDGKTAWVFGKALDTAIKTMKADPARFRRQEPDNGWGTYESTLDFLEELHAACLAHPLTTVRVSR